MITTRPGDQAPALDPAVPPLDDDLQELFDQLVGFGPGIDQILDGLRFIALQRHTTDSSRDHLAALAGDGPSVTALFLRVIARLGDSGTNPGLRALPVDCQDAVRELTGDYAALAAESNLNKLIAEANAVIDGV